MEMLSNVKEGYEGFLSSLSELGALNISYLEKLSEKQFESTQFVANLGFEHMKKVVGVDSLDAAQALPTATLEAGAKLARKTMDEGKSLMDMGSSYKSDVTDLFKKKTKKSA